MHTLVEEHLLILLVDAHDTEFFSLFSDDEIDGLKFISIKLKCHKWGNRYISKGNTKKDLMVHNQMPNISKHILMIYQMPCFQVIYFWFQ